MNAEHIVEVLHRHRHRQLVARKASCVNQDRDALSVQKSARCRQCAPVLGSCCVTAERRQGKTFSLSLGDGSFRSLCVVRVRNRDRHPLCSQSTSHRETDASRATCHQSQLHDGAILPRRPRGTSTQKTNGIKAIRVVAMRQRPQCKRRRRLTQRCRAGAKQRITRRRRKRRKVRVFGQERSNLRRTFCGNQATHRIEQHTAGNQQLCRAIQKLGLQRRQLVQVKGLASRFRMSTQNA